MYANYLTDRTLNQETATRLAPWLVVEVDVFPKCTPPIVLQMHGRPKLPLGSLSRSYKGLWAVGVWILQNVLEGGIPARSKSWKALAVGANNVPQASNGTSQVGYGARTMCGTVQQWPNESLITHHGTL